LKQHKPQLNDLELDSKVVKRQFISPLIAFLLFTQAATHQRALNLLDDAIESASRWSSLFTKLNHYGLKVHRLF